MIALGCDHGGYELKQEIKKYLDEKGIEYKDYGCDSLDSVDYPVYAKKVAHAILDGECEKGILICGIQTVTSIIFIFNSFLIQILLDLLFQFISTVITS